MPQTLLPIYGDGQIQISELVWYKKDLGQIYYFHGGLPIFTHAVDDGASFRLITSQLVAMGNCRQSDIVRTFGIAAISVKRYAKKYRQQGAAGFFAPRRTRGANVLTQAMLARAQDLLSSGLGASQTARQLDLKPDTVRKAIAAGRLTRGGKKRGP